MFEQQRDWRVKPFEQDALLRVCVLERNQALYIEGITLDCPLFAFDHPRRLS